MGEDVDCLEGGREAHLDMVVQNITFPPYVQVFTSGQGIGIINFEHKRSMCHVSQGTYIYIEYTDLLDIGERVWGLTV
jgi:hypothetical protein